jgi:hypothetical protein
MKCADDSTAAEILFSHGTICLAFLGREFRSLSRGVKECEGNERIKGYTDAGLVCWTGNDDEAHDARYEAGAVGVISVTSNIVPGLMQKMICDGPNPELRDQLLPLMNW